MPVRAHTRENLELGYTQDCLGAYLFQRPFPEAPAELNWDKLYRTLIQQQLPGLFIILVRADPALVPKSLRNRLREARFEQLIYTDWCANQAGVVLASLINQHIPVIVLKGWALVQLIYQGDYSQRLSSDIDLLVRPEHAARAIDVLHGLGYTATDVEPWPGYFRRFLNGVHYTSEHQPGQGGSVFNVDLHWGFPDSPYYDRRIAIADLFASAQAIQVAGVAVYSLSTEALLIYGGVHMAHHGYTETLSRYYDMAALIRQAGGALDWNLVLSKARAWRVTLPLRRMLAEIETTWPGILPVGLRQQAQQLRPGWMERLVDWGLRKAGNTLAAGILLAVLNTPGLWWRLRFFLETAFPSQGYLQHYFGPAPAKLWPWLYFRRFKRFLGG